MEAQQTRTISFNWNKQPEELSLASGQVHIWKVPLDDAYSYEAGSVLSAEELQRSLRLISPTKRARFQCAHVAVRMILSQYLSQAPESIQFNISPQGKPSIKSPDTQRQVEFNISHAEDLMLAAITTCGPLGIDLEKHQSIREAERIVTSYFSTQDLELFKHIPQEEKADTFLSAWVLKEAYGKAQGSGLAASPARDHFTHFTRSRLALGQGHITGEENLQILQFAPAPDFQAAAVVRTSQEPQFLFWEAEFEG